jgi:hypothetical protein
MKRDGWDDDHSRHATSCRVPAVARDEEQYSGQSQPRIQMSTIDGGRSAPDHDHADRGSSDHKAVTAFVRKMLGSRTAKAILVTHFFQLLSLLPGAIPLMRRPRRA